MKTAVFTANFGKYDKFVEPVCIDPDFDYYIFTDNWDFQSKVYETIIINPSKDNIILSARLWKIINGYEYFKRQGYDTIIWHDANFEQIASLKPLVNKMRTDIMVMKHPNRNCVYQEYEACANYNKDNIDKMYYQVQQYAYAGYPKNNGMVATGLIIRKVSDEAEKFSKLWANEVKDGSIRDQLSFNYIAWFTKIRFDMIPFDHTLTFYFKYRKHVC